MKKPNKRTQNLRPYRKQQTPQSLTDMAAWRRSNRHSPPEALMSDKKTYIVYDGRANVDVGCATVLEVIDADDVRQARNIFRSTYKDHDAVLTLNNEIIDSTIWRILYDL